MSTAPNYKDETFIKHCNAALVDYLEGVRGIDNAVLATPDGFEITSSSVLSSSQSADRLAAVGSSLFALGVSLIQEFNLQQCKSITLDSDKGTIFISNINNMEMSIILMVQTNNQAMLGTVIHGAKKLTKNISEKMHHIN